MIVDDAGAVATGTYRLTLAKTGSPVVVSAGDEGGPPTNGLMYTGTIDVGDLDVWTFTANAGENMVLRMGELVNGSTLSPYLRLYGPDGALLDSGSGAFASEVAARATSSGTFTVVASDLSTGYAGSGTYRLTLAKTGSPIVVSAGDEGGPMTGAGVYDGTIDTGDIDAWTFTACAGDIISLNVTELVSGSTFTPQLRLYGRDGVLLKSLSGAATAQFTNFPAPASGTYTVVVSDLTAGWSGTGTYRLTVNGLIHELKMCPAIISGANLSALGIGGVPGASFTLLTTTNVDTPVLLWTPFLTNQFDQFGTFNLTNLLNRNEPQRFFLLRTP